MCGKGRATKLELNLDAVVGETRKDSREKGRYEEGYHSDDKEVMKVIWCAPSIVLQCTHPAFDLTGAPPKRAYSGCHGSAIATLTPQGYYAHTCYSKVVSLGYSQHTKRPLRACARALTWPDAHSRTPILSSLPRLAPLLHLPLLILPSHIPSPLPHNPHHTPKPRSTPSITPGAFPVYAFHATLVPLSISASSSSVPSSSAGVIVCSSKGLCGT
ncbi:hypothetical protein NMY22_g5291 [Coprinellus aureogranulatus]|nr:hypothetical protein NMY22_g5291 [Coprinellus aureogranulatus]